MENSYEFLLVLNYLKAEDLLTLRLTCKNLSEYLRPYNFCFCSSKPTAFFYSKAPFWKFYVNENWVGSKSVLDYLSQEGVLARAICINEYVDSNGYEVVGLPFPCLFCLQKRSYDYHLGFGRCFMIAVCYAEKCRGYAKFLLEYFIPEWKLHCSEALIKFGLDPLDHQWEIERCVQESVVGVADLDVMREGHTTYFDPLAFATRIATNKFLDLCLGHRGNDFCNTLLKAYYCKAGKLIDFVTDKTIVIHEWPWQSIGAIRFDILYYNGARDCIVTCEEFKQSAS